MAEINKDIQIKIKGIEGWENLFPITKANLVNMDSEKSVQEVIEDMILTVADKTTIKDVNSRIEELIGGAPEALDTLVELAAALGNDENFAATMTKDLGEKASKEIATALENGLMSKEDKVKLDSIAADATEYEHPESHPASMITESEDKSFVSNSEKTTWNNKVDKEEGKNLSSNDFSDEHKTKLANIEEEATKYTHPENHDASIITQDDKNRFVSDEEKIKWTAKSEFDLTVTNKVNEPTDAKIGDIWCEIAE